MSDWAFDPSAYSSVAASLLAEDRLPALGPGSPNQSAKSALRALTIETLAPAPAKDSAAAQACLSGLWLWHDFLDESHTISQDIHTADGSMWHAIMHRREPDAWNSKYWWRQVGSHPVLKRLVEESPSIGYAYRDPSAFVDFCESVRGKNNAEEALAKKVQALEWRLLFDHCWQRAFG